MKHSIRTLITCSSLALASLPISAAWVFSPAVDLQSNYNDNIRMSQDETDPAFTTSIAGQLSLRNVTEKSEIAAIAGVNFLKYSDSADLKDQSLQFLNFTARTNGTRLTFGVSGSYKRDLTLRWTSFIPEDTLDEIESDSLDEPLDDALGDLNSTPNIDDAATFSQFRRERIRIDPKLSWRFTERTTASLQLSHTELNYAQAATQSFLQGNKKNALTLNFRHRISTRDILSIKTIASTLKPEATPKTHNYQLTAIWDRKFSERSNIGVSLGVRHTKQNVLNPDISNNRTGLLFGLKANRRFERTFMRATYNRSMIPNSFGDLVETDTINLNIQHSLSDRVFITSSCRAYHTQSPARNTDSPDILGRDQDYVQINAGLGFAFSPSLTINSNYGFRWIDQERLTGTSTSNMVSLGITYRPPKRL